MSFVQLNRGRLQIHLSLCENSTLPKNQIEVITTGKLSKLVKIPIFIQEIPLPPLPVQRQIVAILEQAEVTKRLRAESDELTQRFLQSVFMEMFGDPVKNEKGWETLNSICKRFSKKITEGIQYHPR